MTTAVAITGVGCLTALGTGRDALGDGPAREGSRVEDARIAAVVGTKGVRTFNRESRLFTAAGILACADAGLDPATWDRRGVGVFCGTMRAGLEDYASLYADGVREGPDAVNPAQGPQTGLNAPAAQLSIHLGAEGPNMTFSSGLASSTDALAYAADFLRAGRADVVLAGGVETLAPVIAEDAGPPGEAAAVLVLEREETARERGAEIRAVLAGSGNAFDAGGDAGEAGARAIAAALADAGLEAEPDPSVTSVPGALGRTHGAAGALQAAAAVFSLDDDGARAGAGAVLVHSVDIGGGAAALVLIPAAP